MPVTSISTVEGKTVSLPAKILSPFLPTATLQYVPKIQFTQTTIDCLTNNITKNACHSEMVNLNYVGGDPISHSLINEPYCKGTVQQKGRSNFDGLVQPKNHVLYSQLHYSPTGEKTTTALVAFFVTSRCTDEGKKLGFYFFREFYKSLQLKVKMTLSHGFDRFS